MFCYFKYTCKEIFKYFLKMLQILLKSREISRSRSGPIWTVFISLYRSLYMYRVRGPIYSTKGCFGPESFRSLVVSAFVISVAGLLGPFKGSFRSNIFSNRKAFLSKMNMRKVDCRF